MSQVINYKDFDATFQANPITGDINVLTNESAIRNACINLVFLEQFDKPFREELWCGVHGLLFEPLTIVTADILKDRIESVIRVNEPRVDEVVAIVSVDSTKKGYAVSIRIRPKNSLQFVQQDFFLTRLF